ncbi:hypothetical protein GH733_010138, partial [Mirounga leonina]
MAGPFTFTLLCGLLAATLAGATLNPPAVLSLGREIIKETLGDATSRPEATAKPFISPLLLAPNLWDLPPGLTQELNDHDAISILQQLSLLSTIREKPARGIPILGSVVNSILNHIIWLKVTSANILQLQVDPSDEGQGLAVKIPLDMVAGLNTPLVKTIVEIHMETEVQAIIRVNTRENTHLVLDGCSNSPGSLRISLLHTLSFLVNSLAHTVMSLLVPALPKLVKTQLCPVIQAAFEDMHADLLHLVRVPVSLSSDRLEFDLLSPAIKGDVIQLELGAKLLDSHGDVTKWFNKSAISLTVPYLDSTPFSLTVRQDVVNAAVTALLPPEEIVVLLDYVLPELAHRLKSNIKVISEQAANQLGPTQMVKILTRETPELLLDQGSARVAQLIVLEVFATNEAHYPFFTLGIPELLKNITTEILVSVLLPNEN